MNDVDAEGELPASETDVTAQTIPDGDLPDDLPPVEPPSAGFIVQLFVVPALIVMVIVGLWILFGKLASSEQDWRSLTQQLASQNEIRRWQAALGLAQMLKTDQDLGESGQQLAKNPEVATSLLEMLDEQLESTSATEDDLKHQEFLAKTLGYMDQPDIVMPVLQRAMEREQDAEVRKNAIAAVALIAGRAEANDTRIDSPDVVDSLIRASFDPDVLIRQLSTYALGLFSGDTAINRLRVVLEDTDQNTRYNAAIGLARRDSSEGLPIFESVLEQAAEPYEVPASPREPNAAETAGNREFREPVMLRNSLRAIRELSSSLTSEQKQRLTTLIEPISSNYHNTDIRVDAQGTLGTLSRP